MIENYRLLPNKCFFFTLSRKNARFFSKNLLSFVLFAYEITAKANLILCPEHFL